MVFGPEDSEVLELDICGAAVSISVTMLRGPLFAEIGMRGSL